jgi:hypothetical protein
VGQQPPPWPVAGDSAPRFEVYEEVVAFQVLDSGSQVAACGAACCAAQVLDRGAQVAACGAVRCASQIIDRGAQVFARGAATLLQQEKTTRQMYSGIEWMLPALSVQWQVNPRGDVPLNSSNHLP